MDEGFDAHVTAVAHVEIPAYEEDEVALLTDDDALRYDSVTEVTKLLRSSYLSAMLRRLSDYEQTAAGNKNAIPSDDPEYQYVSDCSSLVLRIEVEKSRVHVFLRAQYSARFPELAMFFSDSVLYAKVVKIIQNNMDISGVVGPLDELIPSQLLVVIVACAATTAGRDLTSEELRRILEACEELENLEMAKQTFLEYIQCSMPLICPNLCAFLGTGITSQLFAIAGSVTKLSIMDPTDIAKLGSRRSNDSGIAIKTTGFLSNCDLVANLPPQLRPKALRLVSSEALNLARIDANRRAPTNYEGVRTRRLVCNRMRAWLDPPVLRGAGHNMYERRGRKRRRTN
ncbi:putative trans-splicing factor [Leptomonas pyrrhocoris]|uniref:Putative trans-splicing factor n=1 Tax=Leptomonas pyrrhocoris TaxID=157538 RepID=A0A0M9FVL6_LEPPY|nr:putative trans-splicing factor [Leptomonas pyrrhocoris]XP_015655296.1 putative trans-splicing factor [Leptomonas pyrrhocoris]KPA76856.1 putative trans-splicing factor [Leptomonas pyrrhocoris]KPA76857.1 putative trans-splicing factor [Leptomonas pyrrhocoris]|eukprot:XP_015655295.1 putative trans-splicing factor [Leptomonas pyrrhocoris]